LGDRTLDRGGIERDPGRSAARRRTKDLHVATGLLDQGASAASPAAERRPVTRTQARTRMAFARRVSPEESTSTSPMDTVCVAAAGNPASDKSASAQHVASHILEPEIAGERDGHGRKRYNSTAFFARRTPMSQPPEKTTGLTYRDAGVDIHAGDELVERIKPLVRRAQRPEVLAGIGGFGALVELPPGRWKRPVLVSGTDGVGTKLRLAIDTGAPRRHRHRPRRHVRERRRRAGRRTAVLPRLLRHRQTRRSTVAERVIAGIVERLQAGRLRAGRWRDRRDARHVSRAAITTSPAFCVGVVERDAIIDGSRGRARR
jgi:hypothetical protein